MRFALVDLKFRHKKANRDHTGGFGSYMEANGAVGRLASRVKASLIELPVMALGFSTALLRAAGHEVTFTYGDDLAEQDVVIIANSMHCYADELAWARRQKQRMPAARIGFYGPFVQQKPELFRDVADFTIGGELESTLYAFLEGQHDFRGELNCGVVGDLTRLPPPDWDLMDFRAFNYFPLLHKRPMFPVLASRGCSYNCDFCPYMVSQTKLYRRRRPEDVVDELERNVRRYGMKSFLFRDICFTLDKRHAQRIAERIIERGLAVEWACETRIDCLTEELVDTMVRSGLRGVNIGIETGNNENLAASGKRNPAVEIQEAMIAYLHRRGVRINGFYMLGLLGDTPETMDTTIRYARHLKTMGAQFCITTPFPGTPMHEKVKERLLTEDYTQYTEYRPVLDIGTSTPGEVAAAQAAAYRRFYLSPGWMVRQAPGVIRRLLLNRIS